MNHWHAHPHVRTCEQLSMGERAADRLKAAFGSWTFLMLLNGFIVAWIAANLITGRPWDPYPFILLNLGLSWLAAQQGGALQIAANRGDRIASEVAMGTYRNGEELLTLNKRQLEILGRLDGLDAKVEALAGKPRAATAAERM